MPEMPVLPTKAERVDPTAEFDVLQHQAKAFDQILCNMADVVDMTDKLADAAKKAGSDKGEDSAHRKARSHRVLQPIVNEAVRQSGNVEKQLADFLKASPVLARHLARWQSEE